MDKVAYKLELSISAQIHNVFHMSQLKKAQGYDGQVIPLPTGLKEMQEYEPVAILERGMVKRGNRVKAQILIHWGNLSPAEATWEFVSEIRRRFPFFSLEDKGSQAGRIIMKKYKIESQRVAGQISRVSS